MTCSRCTAEAIVKRGNASYCAKCAMARDWEDVIAIVQEERVEMAVSEPIAAPPPSPTPPPPSPNQAEGAPPAPAAERAAVAAQPGSADLPADPFA